MNREEQAMDYENLVRQEWTNGATVDAWDRWADEQAVHCQPLTDALIKHAQLSPGMQVLDIAGGVGQPSFSIARLVGPTGKVVLTDLSEGMLAVAAQNSQAENLHNIEFKVADVHALPFADNSFDRVVSRLGLMYFWDIHQAIREIYRVLKPGGIASFVVWGAGEKNQYFGTILSAFMQRKDLPEMPEDAPVPMRFGNLAALTETFACHDFVDVQTQEYCEPLPWPGTPRSLYEHFYDMAVPLQPYIDSFNAHEQSTALGEIEQAFAPLWDGTHTRAKASFNLLSAVK